MNPILTIPSHEDIGSRAEQLWRLAGNPLDRDLEFWLAAEIELDHERAALDRALRAPSVVFPPLDPFGETAPFRLPSAHPAG